MEGPNKIGVGVIPTQQIKHAEALILRPDYTIIREYYVELTKDIPNSTSSFSENILDK